eukprot:gene14658-20692_t
MLLVTAPLARAHGAGDLDELFNDLTGENAEDYEEGELVPILEFDEIDVVDLNSENFDKIVKSAPFAMFAAAATEITAINDSIVFGKVDCTVNDELQQSFNIEGYPTVLWFVNGQMVEEFDEDRERNQLWQAGLSMKETSRTPNQRDLRKLSVISAVIVGAERASDVYGTPPLALGLEWGAWTTVSSKVDPMILRAFAFDSSPSVHSSIPTFRCVEQSLCHDSETINMSNTNTAAPVRQLDVSSRSLIVSDSFRGLPIKDTGSGKSQQTLLNQANGLPIKDTGSGKSQHTLLNQARSQGFQLEVLVPPFLHKLSFEEEIWDVGDAEAWDHLLSFLPSSNDEAANLLLDDCFNKYSNAKPFTKVLEGCHGVWEMAIMCTEQDIGQVCPVRAKDGTILGEESSDEEEGFSLYKKVKRLPSSKSVLHSLLKSKLMPTAAALLREMSRMTKGKGAEKLRYGARMKHTALMAAWEITRYALEIMRYALGITFVKNTMKNVCASFFDSHHPGGAAFFRSSDGGRISATIVISGSGSKAAAKGIKGEDEEQSAPRPYQVTMDWKTVGIEPELEGDLVGIEPGVLWSTLLHAPAIPAWLCANIKAEYELERDLVGIEPEVLWSTLLHAAAIPAWLCADIKPEYEVAPVAYEAATRTIQNQWRTMVAKVEIAKLKEQMKNVMARDKKSLLSRNNGKTISDADRDAWSQAVAMAEAKELSGLDAVMAGLKNYFDFQHQTCPSVAAVECLLSTVLDCPQQQEHFLQHAELPLLLNLLQESLPLRTQHLACVLLSLFFRTKARCGVAAWLPGGRTTDVSSVHDLLPRLVHVTAIEPAEQEFRYGDWQRTHTDHPTKILGAYQPPLLKEVRCSAHGSEISVHAATCVWGSGKLLAAEALMAFRKAQALYLKGALDPEAQVRGGP